MPTQSGTRRRQLSGRDADCGSKRQSRLAVRKHCRMGHKEARGDAGSMGKRELTLVQRPAVTVAWNALASSAVLALIAATAMSWPSLFRAISQEDGPIEWATFWAFAAAAVVAVVALLRLPLSHRNFWTRSLHLGFALGCIVVALEEISWGQRLFGYRPPDLFLSANFQQELNFHNLVGARARKESVFVLLLGYGVLLPMLRFVRPLGAWFEAKHVRLPAIALMPLFIGAAMLYAWYPWSYVGEWVEWLAGLGFLIGALDLLAVRVRFASWHMVLAGAAPLALGLLTAQLAPTSDQAEIQRAQIELQLLGTDFQNGTLRARCGAHERMVSVATAMGGGTAANGAFGRRMSADGLALARGQYFVDPWYLSYWVRRSCTRQNDSLLIYSFGPDRRRDSTPSQLLGDDVGVWLSRERRN